jgi:flagellin-like protein
LRPLHGRKGISEIIGTLLAIAITVTAGAAVFGFVNSQAGVSENQYGSSVGSSVSYLQERFTVANVNFTNTAITVWLYNDGQIVLSPVEVVLYNTGRSLSVIYNSTTVESTGQVKCTVGAASGDENPGLWNTASVTGLQVPVGSIQTLRLDLPCTGQVFSPGTTYTVSILGLYGNIVTYSQAR